VRDVKEVLIVSHADADGHLIAEQVRRNLAAVPAFRVSTVVDPVRTKDHRTWTRLDGITEIETADLVFFVDLMFAPASFVAEADALVDFVRQRPEKRFFLLDHHPLPLERLRRAPNLRAVYRSDVVDCTFGQPSWLMVIAALVEKQPTRVRAENANQRLFAEGIKRAAAPGGPLPGDKLLALLRFGCWGELLELGRDDREFHRLPRGLRPSSGPTSDVLERLDKRATDLLKASCVKGSRGEEERSRAMSYDLDLLDTEVLPAPSYAPYRHDDLEAIVTLLELAAIYLTPDPDSSFTQRELIDKARELGGDEIIPDEVDLKIVLGKAGFLKKLSAGRFRMK
jgi:hypothetical protein